EHLSDARRFVSAVRIASLNKPILVIKRRPKPGAQRVLQSQYPLDAVSFKHQTLPNNTSKCRTPWSP
ncbi:hypothetical protein, partial [Enterobacter asburiae]